MRNRFNFKRKGWMNIVSWCLILITLFGVAAGFIWTDYALLSIFMGIGLMIMLGFLALVPVYYEERENEHHIQLLFSSKHLKKSEYEVEEVNPALFRRSIRTFGAAPFFGYTGWYSNRSWGSFQSYIADASAPMIRFVPKYLSSGAPNSGRKGGILINAPLNA